jgi:hypothetical protein
MLRVSDRLLQKGESAFYPIIRGQPGVQGGRGLQSVLSDCRQNLRFHPHPPRSVDAALTDRE